MLKCVLCQENQMIWYNLCDDCLKIQTLMGLYTPSTIHQFIEKTLKIQEDKMDYRIAKNISDILNNANNDKIKKKE